MELTTFLVMALAVISTATCVSGFSSPLFSVPATRHQAQAKSLSQLGSTSSRLTVGGRRAFVAGFSGIAFVAASPLLAPTAQALDMDAFANSELASDKAKCNEKLDPKCVPKLTEDEALCKYGQSGEKRGEACRRVKAAGGALNTQKAGKSPGGAYAM